MNDLHDLLHDAVDDVEPADRLDRLRARTASPVRAAARPWWWAAGATVLATAAAVAVVAVVSDGSETPGHHHNGIAMDPPASTQLVAAYFIGDSPDGPRLFREFDRVPAGDAATAALARIQEPPGDLDYTTPWDPGSLTGVTVDDGVITVHIGSIDPSVSAGQLGVQQVVYTLQAAVGERLPVRFVGDDDFVYMGPMGAADQRAVLNPVSISDPAEGNEYAASFTARGRVGSTERRVGWGIFEGPDSQTPIVSGFATIEAGTGKLSPWTAEVDLSGLAPGRYAFTVWTGKPGYGDGPFTDTRTIIVR